MLGHTVSTVHFVTNWAAVEWHSGIATLPESPAEIPLRSDGPAVPLSIMQLERDSR